MHQSSIFVLKRIAIVYLLTMFGASNADYPLNHPETLRGKTTFDVSVNFLATKPQDLLDRRFEEETIDLFLSILESNKIIADVASLNILDCDVKAASVSDSVVFTYQLAYYFYSDDLYPLMFESGNFFIDVVSIDDFSPVRVAEACASEFLDAWQESNPSLPASRRI